MMPGTDSVLHVEQIHKSFPDGTSLRTVLAGADLSISSGEMVGIQGPSGCGKTTLLNICCGVLRPDQGRVVLNGTLLDFQDPGRVAQARRHTVGLVSQRFGLHPDESVLANVALPLRFHRRGLSRQELREKADWALELAGCAVNPRQRPSRLSAGEAQRAALARALITDPPLVVVDEPTSALDAATAAHVVSTLRRLADDGRTVLVATHDATVAVACHRLMAFDAGRLSAVATHPS